jgi:hypothetical protein
MTSQEFIDALQSVNAFCHFDRREKSHVPGLPTTHLSSIMWVGSYAMLGLRTLPAVEMTMWTIFILLLRPHRAMWDFCSFAFAYLLLLICFCLSFDE